MTNIVGETYALYANDGHAVFEDARVKTGLAAPTAAFTGFGTGWVDYDNDGLLDLFVANGAVNVIEAQRGQPSPFRMRNQLFHNIGGRFQETSGEGGEGGSPRRLSLVERRRGGAGLPLTGGSANPSFEGSRGGGALVR